MKHACLLIVTLLALAGCGSSASRATGPTAPIVIVCAESTTSSTSGATSDTTAINNCDKHTASVPAEGE